MPHLAERALQEQNGRFRRLVPRTLRFDVVQSIRAAILDGTLSAGSPLVEARLAEEMGISRAPVREALRQLEEEGLVVSIPYKGTYVTQVTPEAMLEIASLRTVLEGFAAELALPRLQRQGLERFRTLLAAMHAAAADDNVALLVEEHLSFHRSLYELAEHALLLQFWNIMEGQLRLYLRVNILIFGSLEEVAAAHDETLQVLEAGDLPTIKRHLAQHILGSAEKLARRRQPSGRGTAPTR